MAKIQEYRLRPFTDKYGILFWKFTKNWNKGGVALTEVVGDRLRGHIRYCSKQESIYKARAICEELSTESDVALFIYTKDGKFDSQLYWEKKEKKEKAKLALSDLD